MEKQEIKTQEEARQFAIDWQSWASGQSMSWEEITDWGYYFAGLAGEFDLTEEFKENGII